MKAPITLGDIVTEPEVNSDSEAAVPSVAIQPADEAAVFLGITTLPCNPLSIVAPACITEDSFLNTSIKLSPL